MATDFAVFSYLAAVTTLHVPKMPPEDYGELVVGTDTFIAGDGPIAAGVARVLGLSVALVTNPIARDSAGATVEQLLARWDIPVEPLESAGETPHSTVVAAATGSRTFFPYLPNVVGRLQSMDLRALSRAAWAYVDCYEVLGTATERAVIERLRGDGPLMVNLGGSPVPDWLQRSRCPRLLAVLQTSVADGELRVAHAALRFLVELGVANAVVVTLGSGGALGWDGLRTWHATVHPISPLRVQGAGAALSAAFVVASINGAPFVDALRFGCAAGTAWCLEATDPPVRDAVHAVLARTSIERVGPFEQW